jgi:hypothetical protein
MKTCIFILMLSFGFPCWGEEPYQKSEELLARVKKELAGQREVSRRSVKRLGNNTIEMEIFAATDGDLDIAKKIFPEFTRYGEWTLSNINKNSSGGDYVLQIKDLKFHGKDSAMEIFYQLKLPIFKHSASRSYAMRLVKPEKTLVIEVEALPVKDSFINASKGRLYVWNGDKTTLWFYFRGHIKLASWMLYEALPEQVVLRESGERIQTLLQNYQKEENRVYQIQNKQVTQSPD